MFEFFDDDELIESVLFFLFHMNANERGALSMNN